MPSCFGRVIRARDLSFTLLAVPVEIGFTGHYLESLEVGLRALIGNHRTVSDPEAAQANQVGVGMGLSVVAMLVLLDVDLSDQA